MSTAARTAKTPSLHAQSILLTHILRAYARTEIARGSDIIDPVGPLGPKVLEGQLKELHLVKPEESSTTYWLTGAIRHRDDCFDLLNMAGQHARMVGAAAADEISTIGLSFIFSMRSMESTENEKMRKVDPYNNPFLTLAIAREVLFDMDHSMRERKGRPLTENIDFDPLDHIQKFYRRTKPLYRHDAVPSNEPAEHLDECVKILTGLTHMLEKFQNSLFSHRFESNFHHSDTSSIRTLRDFLSPYSKGRAEGLLRDAANGSAPESAPVDFAKFAENKRRKNGGIIRNLPAVVPGPQIDPLGP